jgi:hypothetical protein
MDVGNDEVDAGEYCRQVERHLCQRNQGHLVRIVGPAFDLVCGWATRGVPLRVALHGIDRYVDRQAQKGPRRRPIRVDYCDADVLDVFDEWRRATGAPRRVEEPGTDEDEGTSSGRRLPPLAAHLERAVARLTSLHGRRDALGPELSALADRLARELDGLRAQAKTARGDARARILAKLTELDDELLAAARLRLAAEDLTRLAAQADAELRPFRDRMAAEAAAAATHALVDRLVREHYQLPFLRLD